MKVKDIAKLIDDWTIIYICDETGVVLTQTEVEDDSPLYEYLDCEVVNIATYNFGIEIDIK